MGNVDPIGTFLSQEIQRYNNLLRVTSHSLMQTSVSNIINGKLEVSPWFNATSECSRGLGINDTPVGSADSPCVAQENSTSMGSSVLPFC